MDTNCVGHLVGGLSHILPPPVSPYPDRDSCYQAIETAKDIIMSHPKYQKGMHLCVEMTLPRKEPRRVRAYLREKQKTHRRRH